MRIDAKRKESEASEVFSLFGHPQFWMAERSEGNPNVPAMLFSKIKIVLENNI
jgi:hypothetical protein